jgi:hypothetical protein
MYAGRHEHAGVPPLFWHCELDPHGDGMQGSMGTCWTGVGNGAVRDMFEVQELSSMWAGYKRHSLFQGILRYYHLYSTSFHCIWPVPFNWGVSLTSSKILNFRNILDWFPPHHKR